MKAVILMSFFLASFLTFADAQSDAVLAKQWVQKEASVAPTVSGNSCNLNFTYDPGTAGILVVVGDNSRRGVDDYIGVNLNWDDAKISITNNSYTFDLNHGWGSKSTRNKVIVDVDATGKPIHATGVSDIQTISCDLK